MGGGGYLFNIVAKVSEIKCMFFYLECYIIMSTVFLIKFSNHSYTIKLNERTVGADSLTYNLSTRNHFHRIPAEDTILNSFN